MFAKILAVLWGLMPLKVALAIWRIAPAGDLPPTNLSQGSFASLDKNAPWTQSSALAYRLHAEGRQALSPDDEKLIRLVEVRKAGFFDGSPCAPAAILALTLANLGVRLGDLRAINTALKLRDIAARSFPPLLAADRAFFRAADGTLESLLRQIDRTDA